MTMNLKSPAIENLLFLFTLSNRGTEAQPQSRERNLSMTAEKAANPTHPTHAACGPPDADMAPPVTHPAAMEL